MTTTEEFPGRQTRRDILKKAAVVGGAAWAAPVIMSQRAFAQGSLATDLCICPDGTRLSVATVTYRYNGGGCGFAVCGPNTDANTPKCTGGPSSGPATITVYKQTGNLGGGCSTADTILYGPTVVPVGGQFTWSQSGSNATVKVEYYGTNDPDVGPVIGTQILCYHFSCSQPLCFLDTHGPMTVMSYTVSGTCP